MSPNPNEDELQEPIPTPPIDLKEEFSEPPVVVPERNSGN